MKPTHQISRRFFKTPHGELVLGQFQDQLCLCDWRYRKAREQVDNRILKSLNAQFVEVKGDSLLNETIAQLEAYFEGKRTDFDLPLLFVGTEFQQSVWQQLLQIPYGKTCSYLSLSRQLKNEKAIRAVASANGANALSIIVPCHRIIGSKGELLGYAGGLHAKKGLLALENPDRKRQLSLALIVIVGN